MRVLLDTNIIIHREANRVVNEDIGILFRWLDTLKYNKCIHPITVSEIEKYDAPEAAPAIRIKLESYCVMKTVAALAPQVDELSKCVDNSPNDRNDSVLLNELFCDRVDFLITEDKKIHRKAESLGIDDKVFYIDTFIEKCLVENPSLIDYRVQTVKRELFGNIDINDPFFDSLRHDYIGFEKWFAKKADESAYVCYEQDKVCAFLYLKIEGSSENYSNILPAFVPKKRLKIGTLKVTLNGYRIGERFIKIVTDNALRLKVDEIYVTIFENTVEQKRLVRLLEEYGFYKHGMKESESGVESVYVKTMQRVFNADAIKSSYPYIDANRQAFLVPIYPAYHTSLLPDSILSNENPEAFESNESYRNAISKVYICRSIERDIHPGDIIVFYRTGGYYISVITTLGIVESIVTDINDATDFVRLCRQRSVFTNQELIDHWNYNKYNRPFIVNFLYSYSFPHRINMKRLIEIGVLPDVSSAPRGFMKIDHQQFCNIIRETNTDENIIVS